MPKTNPAQCHPPRRRRAHGRLRRLGHAGQLRLADRRAPRGARATRACSTCRTCAPSTSTGAGARDFLRYALANNVDKLKDARQGAVLVPAARPTAACSTTSSSISCARISSASSSTPAPRTRTSRGSGALIAERAPHLTLTPRDDLAMIAVQGPNARAKVWQALPGSEARERGAEAVLRRATRRSGELLHRAHRLHRRGRLRDHGAGRRAPRRRGTRSRRPVLRRAVWARATRCGSRPA